MAAMGRGGTQVGFTFVTVEPKKGKGKGVRRCADGSWSVPSTQSVETRQQPMSDNVTDTQKAPSVKGRAVVDSEEGRS